MKKSVVIAISVVFLLIIVIGVVGVGSKKVDCSGIEDAKQKNRCHLYNLLSSYGFVKDYDEFMKKKPYEKPAPQYFTMKFRDEAVDKEEDGRFDALRIYAEVNVDDAGDYIIETWLHDENNMPFYKFEETIQLQKGLNEAVIEVPSKIVYEKRITGSLKMPYIRLLKDGKQLESVTTEYYTNPHKYSDFYAELPDLIIKSAEKKGDTLQVTIANVGKKHAFSVFIDLIFEGQEIIGKANPYQASLMKIGDEKTFNIDLKGQNVDAVIVDPWNKVDESDEENNTFPIP